MEQWNEFAPQLFRLNTCTNQKNDVSLPLFALLFLSELINGDRKKIKNKRPKETTSSMMMVRMMLTAMWMTMTSRSNCAFLVKTSRSNLVPLVQNLPHDKDKCHLHGATSMLGHS
jgi:hypothetical protein